MYFMYSVVYFAAYSVYSPPMGVETDREKITRAGCETEQAVWAVPPSVAGDRSFFCISVYGLKLFDEKF